MAESTTRKLTAGEMAWLRRRATAGGRVNGGQVHALAAESARGAPERLLGEGPAGAAVRETWRRRSLRPLSDTGYFAKPGETVRVTQPVRYLVLGAYDDERFGSPYRSRLGSQQDRWAAGVWDPGVKPLDGRSSDYGGGMTRRARDFMERRRAWMHGMRAAMGGGVTTPDPETFRENQRRAAAVAAYQSGVAAESRGGRGFEPAGTPGRDPNSFLREDTNQGAALHSFDPKARAEAQRDVDQPAQRRYMGQGNYAPDGTMVAPSASRPLTGHGVDREIDRQRIEGSSDYQRRRDLLGIAAMGGTVADAKGGRTVRADNGGGTSVDYPGSLDSAMTGDAIVDPLLRQVAGNEAARQEYNRILGEHYKAKGRSMDTGAAVIRALWQSGTISRDSARDLAWKLREYRDRKLAEEMAAKSGGGKTARDFYVKTRREDVLLGQEGLAAKYNALHRGEGYTAAYPDGATLHRRAAESSVSADQMEFLARRHGLKVADEMSAPDNGHLATHWIGPDRTGWLPSADPRYSYRFVEGRRQPVYRDNRLAALDWDDVERHPARYAGEISAYKKSATRAESYHGEGRTDWQATARHVRLHKSDAPVRYATGRKVLSARGERPELLRGLHFGSEAEAAQYTRKLRKAVAGGQKRLADAERRRNIGAAAGRR